MREKLLHDVAHEFLKYEIPVSVKQEILQNTMDRYDDYIAQGYTEEDAYYFARESIGDLGEIEKAENAKRPSFKKLIYCCIGAMVLIMVLIYLAMRLYAVVQLHGPRGFGSAPAVIEEDVAVITGTDDLRAVNDVDKINIDWASGSITVETGNVQNVVFYENISGKAEPMDYSVSGSTLNIKYCKSSINLLNFGSKDLTVIVPGDWNAKEIKVDYASAKVNITDITADDIILDGASGSCSLRGVLARKLDADTASGGVTIEDCNIGEADVDGASGKVSINESAVTKLDVNTASGGVTIEGCNIGEADVDGASGKVSINESAVSKLDVNTASGGVDAAFVSVPNHISVDSASGGVSITLPDGAGFTAEFDSASGSFRSNTSFTKNGDKYTFGGGECKIEVDSTSGNLTVNVGK